MSRFMSSDYDTLEPYVPGEQPRDMKYIKLNTNESPFPPSKKAIEYASCELEKLQLYSDPECTDLIDKAAEVFGVEKNEIVINNGSDETLNFAFMAYCDKTHPAVFPNVTYGFYPVFAEINGIPYTEIPLNEDFTINVEDYIGVNKTVFIANPNAPTGIALTLSDIERIVKSNPDNVVVIDEAYIDFGGETAIPLTKKYDNLLVIQTFSKSRSMAGARLGFAIGNKKLIQDLNTIRYSTNPYNINRMTLAAGVGALSDEEYTHKNCKTIIENRAFTIAELEKIGFNVLQSCANFVFAEHTKKNGRDIYLELKARGILVRHFDKPILNNFNRITIGTMEQMQILIDNLKEMVK